jgi:DNA-binding CsgD family transcriptional regulator
MRPTKRLKKPGGKTIAQLVAKMAATGHVEDEIALHLGIDKNTLHLELASQTCR